MRCPIKPKEDCDSCRYGKDSLCDFPYERGMTLTEIWEIRHLEEGKDECSNLRNNRASKGI